MRNVSGMGGGTCRVQPCPLLFPSPRLCFRALEWTSLTQLQFLFFHSIKLASASYPASAFVLAAGVLRSWRVSVNTGHSAGLVVLSKYCFGVQNTIIWLKLSLFFPSGEKKSKQGSTKPCENKALRVTPQLQEYSELFDT